MMRNKIAVLIMTLALGLAVGLTGCDKDTVNSTLAASGYQGKLDDGYSFVYIQLSDDTVMISLTDDEHQGDDAETYTGKAVKDDSGKTTITDEETGESITFTIVENADKTASVDVDGHGKGELSTYEGNIFSVVSSMAEDDAKTSEESGK